MMFRPSRILVPTDMSENSIRSLRQAFDIARQFNSEVFILHVVQDLAPHSMVEYCLNEAVVNQLQAKAIEAVQNEIRRQLALFPSIDPDNVTIDVKTGTPHVEIVKAVEEKNVDLIVILFSGSSGLGKYLVGSVTRHVLLGAKCSVLLTR